MNQTTNYQLSQWESTDRILMSDFNSNNAKLDEALGTLAQTVTGHTTALAQKGNCIVSYTTYQGDGNGRHTLTFSHKPILVVIMQDNLLFVAVQGSPAAMSHNAGTSGGAKPTLTWSGNSVAWSGNSSSSLTCDDPGVTYHVAALLEA